MLSTENLPITYTNLDPSRRNLQHPGAGPYKIIKFRQRNAVELELPADMTIHDPVHVGRRKKYTADRERQKPPPPPVWTVREKDDTIQRMYVVEALISHKRVPGIKGCYKYQI
jgi:hypothetical protein